MTHIKVKRHRDLLLSAKGFSLIELMVVVSIIGVLTAIAVPNYQKSQARIRTIEAKVNLASLYTVELSYYLEQYSYSACLADIGFRSVINYYAIGFGNNGVKCGPPPNSTQGCNNTFMGGVVTTCSVSQSQLQAVSSVGGPPATVTNADLGDMTYNTFTAVAKGQISGNGANPQDVWTINDANLLQNVTPGW